MQLHDHRRGPLANDGDKTAKPAQGLVAHSRSIKHATDPSPRAATQRGHASGVDKEPHIGSLDYRVKWNMLTSCGCH